MKTTQRVLSTVSAIALMTAWQGASAQEEDEAADGRVLEEIVVTARKQEETLQDSPLSINALSQNALEQRGADSIEDVARNVAGFTVQDLGPGQSQVAIRGVSAGQIVRDQPGVKEQVGVYLDESPISLSLFTPDLVLADLNRVEVLRGPQGTLFGSGSLSGTVRYITNEPELNTVAASGRVEGNRVDGGSFGGKVTGMVNVPVGDLAAVRAVAYYKRDPGFIDAVRGDFTRDDDVNDADTYGGRLALKFQPFEGLTITPRVIYQEVEVEGFNREEEYNILANPFTTERRPVELGDYEQFLLLDEAFEDEFLLADALIELELGSFTFTSITSYTDRDILVSRDASALTGSVSFDVGLPDEAVLTPSNLRDATEVEVLTQEARMAYDAGGRFSGVVGLFYSDIERIYGQSLPTPGYDQFLRDVGIDPVGDLDAAPPNSPFFSNIPYDLTQFAVFAEGSVEVTDRLTLTAGVRYYDFEEERTLTFDGFFAAETDALPGETESDGFTPRFIASYDVTDDILVSAQASRGFRLGGINDPLNVPLCSPQDLETFGGFDTFDDETLWNYEGNTKVTFAGGAGTFNAAVFYADINDLQATVEAGTCSSRLVFNVPEARSLGTEFELAFAPTESFDFAVSGSYIDSEVQSTVVSVAPDGSTSVVGGIEDGNRLPTVPRLQLSAAATYQKELTTNMTGFITGTFQHVGSRFTQLGDQAEGFGTFEPLRTFGGVPAGTSITIDPELPAYQIGNVRAGVRSDRWEAALFINNVWDERALLSFDRERGGFARLGFRVNQPRTFGLALSAQY